MIKKKHIITTLIALLFFSNLQAQNRVFGLKLYPVPLIFGKTALQAELMLSPNRSLTFDYSNRDVDVTKGIIGELIVENVDEPVSGTYKSLILNPSFRMYSKKKEGPRGLYFAIGARYTTMETALIVDDDEYPNTAVEASATMFGAQIDMGVQWLIGNRVSIDWNFLGLGGQFGNLEGFGISPNLDPTDAQDFADEVNRIADQVPLVNLEFVADGNTVSASGNQFIPIARSRLSIGIFF